MKLVAVAFVIVFVPAIGEEKFEFIPRTGGGCINAADGLLLFINDGDGGGGAPGVPITGGGATLL